MGKVRVSKRCRLHFTALRDVKEVNATADITIPESSEVVKLKSVAPLPTEILQSVPVVHFKEDVVSKSGGPVEQKTLMKKKDRRKLRHESWLKKIDVCRLAKEESKAREERKKTVVVGDMQPLVNALPDLPIMTRQTNKGTGIINSHKVQHRSM